MIQVESYVCWQVRICPDMVGFRELCAQLCAMVSLHEDFYRVVCAGVRT
jgi:hypothetical protein